eukprot:TRINITY_DN4186_c0_g1_i10.p1 TRINITY_DN4186_c0_g1~~TRINITY_DN4186_c0_g1_i10.p1  ORF type:complete len:268 (+),score=59.83 TRINITY_DN4186_c0_g1_i10:324-1127(+)
MWGPFPSPLRDCLGARAGGAACAPPPAWWWGRAEKAFSPSSLQTTRPPGAMATGAVMANATNSVEPSAGIDTLLEDDAHSGGDKLIWIPLALGFLAVMGVIWWLARRSDVAEADDASEEECGEELAKMPMGGGAAAPLDGAEVEGDGLLLPPMRELTQEEAEEREWTLHQDAVACIRAGRLRAAAKRFNAARGLPLHDPSGEGVVISRLVETLHIPVQEAVALWTDQQAAAQRAAAGHAPDWGYPAFGIAYRNERAPRYPTYTHHSP